MFNTTYFPTDKLVYYILMNALGHMFVNSSNLNLERKHLLHSNHRRNLDFYLAVVFAPIFFMLSSIMVLRSVYSIYSSQNCI